MNLNVLRKWIKLLLQSLLFLHTQAASVPLIHGHIQCDSILFIRNNGLVKLGGYSWLCKETDACNYDFPERVKQDINIGYFPQEVFTTGKWSTGIDIYALGMTVIHFLTQKPPYEEKKTNDERINAILHGEPPEGKRMIREIDDMLFDFVDKCLLPESIRPGVEDLLHHPFLFETNNKEIQFPFLRNQLGKTPSLSHASISSEWISPYSVNIEYQSHSESELRNEYPSSESIDDIKHPLTTSSFLHSSMKYQFIPSIIRIDLLIQHHYQISTNTFRTTIYHIHFLYSPYTTTLWEMILHLTYKLPFLQSVPTFLFQTILNSFNFIHYEVCIV